MKSNESNLILRSQFKISPHGIVHEPITVHHDIEEVRIARQRRQIGDCESRCGKVRLRFRLNAAMNVLSDVV